MLSIVLVSLCLCCIIAAFAAAADGGVPVIVENLSGEAASGAPASAGIPFKRGALDDPGALSLEAGGKAVPLQAACTSRWPDGSCRWVLLDFQTDAAAGASADYTLATNGGNVAPGNGVTVAEEASGVTLSNGIVTYTAQIAGSSGLLKTADGKASAEIISTVEIGDKKNRITSEVVVDSMEVYARGPLRAAVALYGRRIYSDGMEGPFSQRVEMFAASPYIRVEDTFIYAHLPGTHAEPQNPLGLWQIEAKPDGDASRLAVASLMYDEEAEGLVVEGNRVAFWGADEPFDLSRWTDEELVGEDTPGIALGVGKSCAVAVGLPEGGGAGRPVRDLFACTTAEVYAASRALGDFAPAEPGSFEKVERGMKRLLDFWMWFQDNDPHGVFGRGPWHGLFDWGDWQCSYRSRKGGEPGWTYHEGRYGWDCNEMDTTLMLWDAFFHDSRNEYWRAAVAMSRHMMDVDMINVDYSKYNLPEYVYDPHVYYRGATWREGVDRMKDMNTIGLGRRHNVQHWGNGVGDTRHTWNAGLMMYYYMTGNRRAYDAIIQMAEMHMLRMFGCAAGEYTLSLWCFYNAWQMTGSDRYLDEFTWRLGLVHKFRKEDGTLASHIDFQNEADYPEVQKGGGSGAYLDLTLDYVSSALVDYHGDTRDETAADILMGLSERIMRDNPTNPGDFSYIDTLRVLSWAYIETGDGRFLDRVKFHLSSLEAEPLESEPADPDAWLAAVKDILSPFNWSIRHVGPGIRMAPYAMQAIMRSKEND